MANIVYGQMSAWMQKPQGGGKFLVQIPGVRGGDGYVKN